jgi:hypothetical protein
MSLQNNTSNPLPCLSVGGTNSQHHLRSERRTQTEAIRQQSANSSWTQTKRDWRKYKLREFHHLLPAGVMRCVRRVTHITEKREYLLTYSVALSPRTNYTGWSTATWRRNLVPTFVDRRVSRGQRGGSPTAVNLSFLDRERRTLASVINTSE